MAEIDRIDEKNCFFDFLLPLFCAEREISGLVKENINRLLIIIVLLV